MRNNSKFFFLSRADFKECCSKVVFFLIFFYISKLQKIVLDSKYSATHLIKRSLTSACVDECIAKCVTPSRSRSLNYSLLGNEC